MKRSRLKLSDGVRRSSPRWKRVCKRHRNLPGPHTLSSLQFPESSPSPHQLSPSPIVTSPTNDPSSSKVAPLSPSEPDHHHVTSTSADTCHYPIESICGNTPPVEAEEEEEFWAQASACLTESHDNSNNDTVKRNTVKKQATLFSFMAVKPSVKKPTSLPTSLGTAGSTKELTATNMTNGFTEQGPKRNYGKGFKTNQRTRTCPFYKWIPGTPFTVDAFRYGSIPCCLAYFLTHFHADHYVGLKRSFQHPIYCSKVTGNLVQQQLKVSDQYIHCKPLNESFLMEKVEVTFLDANHCPGSVLILFRLPSGQNYLHTGDFRFSSFMLLYPPLVGLTVHQLYLDTTYCDPRYDFPVQEHVIGFAVEKCLTAVQSCLRTLIVCGTYTIGKEKVFTAIARILGVKICVSKEKKAVLDCLEDQALSELLTTDYSESRLHVVPMAKLNMRDLADYHNKWSAQYSQLLAFRPTGWSHTGKASNLSSIQPQIRGAVRIYGIPYSEHSSYEELRGCVQALKPHKIIPTVNNFSTQKREEMQRTFQEWMSGKDSKSLTNRIN